MALSKTEKEAGRSFRDSRQAVLDALNRTDPPKAKCSPHSPPFFRHVCTGLGTIAMRLRDYPVPSAGLQGVPEGRFTFTYLEGTCHTCEFLVRSGTGKFDVVEVEKDNG